MTVFPLTYERAMPSFGKPWSPPLETVLAFYPQTLPNELGFPLLVLSLLGIMLAMFVRENAALRFFLTWIVACYLTFTVIHEKSPRYIMAWLLPFVFFAVFLLWRTLERWPPVRLAALVGLAASFYVSALSHERPYVVGCEEAARYLAQQPGSDMVFYQGQLNGNFIFFVRAFDQEKRRLVIREKSIVNSDGHQILRSAESVERMFLENGVRYMVVEDKDFRPELAVTHRALQSDKFELMREIAIQTNDPEWAGVKLLVYRTKSPVDPVSTYLDIPMTRIPQDLHLPLSRLAGKPWPPRRVLR